MSLDRAATLSAARRAASLDGVQHVDVHETGLDPDRSNTRHCTQCASAGSGLLRLIDHHIVGSCRISVTELQSPRSFVRTERRRCQSEWHSIAGTRLRIV